MIGVAARHAMMVRLITALLALAMPFAVTMSATATVPATPPRVLFICQYGTAKSAIAREVFRQRARARGIPVLAYSRGIAPAEHVSPALRARLLADGIDSTRDPVRTLTPDDIRSADIVVTFAPLPKPMTGKRAIDWSASPSMNDAYPRARADLIVRVDALLERIRSERQAAPAASQRKLP